jgi:hypothetical protein
MLFGCHNNTMSSDRPGTIKVRGITVRFLPIPKATSAITLDDGNRYDISADEVEVTLDRNSLSVNGIFVGDVQDSSDVLIQDGNVFINGVRRAT